VTGGRVVAHKESRSERTETSSLFHLVPKEFGATAATGIEAFTKAQTELFGKFQETNRQWLDRVQAEASLATEFTSKMTAARSIPDAMAACQEWTSRRFKMMAEDTQHVLDDAQKFMQMGARLLANGWQS
jgi:hypothetical protein